MLPSALQIYINQILNHHLIKREKELPTTNEDLAEILLLDILQLKKKIVIWTKLLRNGYAQHKGSKDIPTL